MSKFEIESHEYTPQDQYVKEVAIIKFTFGDDSFYVPYCRKATKEGKLFWATATVGYTVDSQKKFVEGFQIDSRHLEKKVKDYLDNRRWEGKGQHAPAAYPHGLVNPSSPISQSMQINSIDEVAVNGELPF